MPSSLSLPRLLAAALAALAAAACGGVASAQVIEIGDGGVVSVFDRPTVFTDAGARPIVAASPARPTASASQRAGVERQIAVAAEAYGLSPALVEAVAWRESGLRQVAVSPKGAVGVMQLMPGTAAELGVDRRDLAQNVNGGAAHLRRMLDRFGGDIVLGLAAYNAGAGAVIRFGGAPPYAETQAYISAILERLARRAPQP